MSKQEFDDETLMAFADGELDEAQSLALEEALADDEALAERLAVFFDSRRLVGDTLKPLIDEPVPEALTVAVQRMVQEAGQKSAPLQDNVVSFPARPHPEAARPAARSWMMPIAASLVAVITGAVGFTLGRIGPSATDSGAEIAAALDRAASGRDVTLGTSVLHVVATFRDERGELCREYRLTQPASNTQTVACRQDGAWTTRLALTTPQAEGYVPASAQETVDAYLASIQAGAPLSAEEERKALSP